MSGTETDRYTFERWELRTRSRELLADGAQVPIGARAFDILLVLVEAGGGVVGKDELLRRAWSGVVVEPNNLQAQVFALRRALGADGARLVATVPGRGYRFAGGLRHEASQRPEPVRPERFRASAPPLPDRPSLAVLPFQSLSADPEQGYFADGMAEEVITALSRVGWLFVIARNSSFAYKGRAVDVSEIGRELGVRYVVDGSVRRALSRVRITSHLVEAATRAEIWADRFDGTIEDVFELQDRVAASIVGAVEPRLRRAEGERALSKPTENLVAYDHYLRALRYMVPRTVANYDEALRLLSRALALDPDFALAAALAAYCRQIRCSQGWPRDSFDCEEAIRLAELALAKAPDHPTVLTHAGHVLGYFGQGLGHSIRLVERALELNPNSALAWESAGWLRLQAGEPEVAVEQFARAFRLSPIDPMMMAATAAMAQAHLLAGRMDAAVEWAERAVRDAPDYGYPNRVLTAALALAGRTEEVAAARERLLRLEPGFTLARYLERSPLRDTPAWRQLAGGLRAAGLPEG